MAFSDPVDADLVEARRQILQRVKAAMVRQPGLLGG